LPIVHIVLNNDELAKISREQVGELRPVWQTSLVNPDFAAFAELCGGVGFRIKSGDELDSVLAAALAVTDRPVMIEVNTSGRWV
jgi:thiamine pyrophosphate-dependent acetolactate synthase large subunit-like protein